MQTPNNWFVASASTHLVVCRLQGWKDLPHELLHSILPLLSSLRDILAFAATCPPWRAVFSSYPSKYTLCPPLLIQPNIRVPAPHIPSDNGHQKLRTCKVIDPAKPNTTMHCQIDEETLHEMYFAGSSYGQLIFCSGQHCLVVDPFSGTKVSPPHFPLSIECGELSVPEFSHPLGVSYSSSEQSSYIKHFCGFLTAPLASPNSHLLVNTRFSLLDWPVGSDSWYELQLSNKWLCQIVEFNGQFIAMDYGNRIYRLQLAPQLGLQEIAITKLPGFRFLCNQNYSWLVVCGDILLRVTRFQIDHLDMSTKPAKWVEMKNLDSWALFLGGHVMSPPVSFMGPERWGGRSKCLYYARYSPAWSVYSLGDDDNPSLRYMRAWCRRLQPLWLYPSMLYRDGQ